MKKQLSLLFAFVIIVSSVSVPLQFALAENKTAETSDYQRNNDLYVSDINVTTYDSKKTDSPSRSTVLITQGYWVLVNGNYKFKLYSTNTFLTNSWINDNGTYYYVGSDGYMYKYLRSIGSYTYYFNGSGAMMTGFITFNEGKRYFDISDGKMHIGWLEYTSHNWYYFNSNGISLKYLQSIAGYTYYFNGAGVMFMGWLQFGDNGYRYFDEKNDSGKMLTGWQTINGNRYHLGSDGYRYTYYCSIGNDHYYFNGSGVMQTGWIQMNESGEWYHFGSDGKLTKYTLTENGNRYCYYPGGTMITGWLNINGDYYYFGNDGAMVYYQQVIDGDHYYFTSEGKMYKGWLPINGNYYYYDTNGKRVTGWKEISNYWYYFDGNGIMQTGWEQIGNYWYFLENDGKMRTADLYQDTRKYKFYSTGQMYTTELLITKITQGVNWCWAASATMAGTYNTNSTITQEDVVLFIKNGLIHEGGSIQEIKDGLEYASNYQKTAYYLSHPDFNNIVYQVDNNRSFVISLQWNNVNYGHAVVGAGYNLNNNSVRVIDPGEGIATTYYSYEQMFNGTDFLSGSGYCDGIILYTEEAN